MSDFGTMLLVHRCDGDEVLDADEALLNDAIKQLKTVERDRIGPYEHLLFKIGSSSRLEGGDGFCATLTEYWVGGDEGNDGLGPDAVLARDQPEADQCGDDLGRLLGSDYTVDLVCDYW